MTKILHFTKTDRVAALAISLIILLIGIFNLDNNCNWGDDYAAYLSDGIAIAQGRYDEQILINSILRDGRLENPIEHIHSFGMPLIHALVYSLFGFGYIYIYKLPSLIALSIASGVFYLFLRNRFGTLLSFFGSILLFSSGTLFYAIRNLGNDILYMSITLMCFFCAECYIYGQNKKIKKAVLLGTLLWFDYSVRLNGIGVVLAVLLSHCIELAASKRKIKIADALPYLIFISLFFVFNVIIFPRPTSTSSFIADFELSKLANGIEYYSKQLYAWVNSITQAMVISPAGYVLSVVFPQKNPVTLYRYLAVIFNALFFLLFAIGIAADGKGRNFYITVFSLVSFFVTASLCLGQELRYLFPVLPFFVMYFCSGAKKLCTALNKNDSKSLHTVGTVFVCAACAMLLTPMVKADVENVEHPERERLTAYSDYAVDIYDYITSNVDDNAVIAFFKPRALYLNTGRISILPGRNGATVDMADYYLYYKPDPEFLLDDGGIREYERIYENEEFELFKKIASAED